MPDTMRLDTIHPFVYDKSLANELLDTPLQDAELARIRGLENMFEAEMIRDALGKEGIFCLIQSNRETAFDGIFIPQRSWGSRRGRSPSSSSRRRTAPVSPSARA